MSSNRSRLDPEQIREDFPIFRRILPNGKPLTYLDSAATSQKPNAVIYAMDTYYRGLNANIHRGVHTLAEEATEAYEGARARIGRFIGAKKAREIIFTRNTTESINLVAQSWGRKNLSAGDVVILTEMEHHSNLVPWQILAAEKDLRLEFVPITEDGRFNMEQYQALLGLNPKLVGFSHMSNVLGSIQPAREIIALAHQAGAIVLVDGAQSVPHLPVDVMELDTDFLAFSGHKMCGPTGIGVLYGKESLLESMPPFLGGGDMIKKVTLQGFTANSLPHKFEAGTPAIAEVIGLGAAVDYLSGLGMEAVAAYEHELARYGIEQLEKVDGLRLLGPDADHKGSVFAFTLGDIHPHDVAQLLDQSGIAVRAGHHCAMPLHQKLNIPASTRASLYIYNSKNEIDRLVESLQSVKKIFG